ncbi:cytochrome C peroxidase [Actinobaculum suis]|uniref:TlyA family RNA methyltransferase n=1 Tax=Actinobaculum suis TaxID=1657 RepID=UPI00066FE81E|nr:TlyA family RNA methyltransferase [Actinobaculum suis]KMY22634.1 cytochrome C peroxidase [Actinobaculum suis]
MARMIRVDAELVRRKMARSRAEASELIRAGRVFLDGGEVTKPARLMDPAQALVVREAGLEHYVSRGAYKLLGALDALGAAGPQIAGVHALDAGASTGGFTDVLLRRGAAHVTAVDVGYGQLAWKLREDPRVTVMERVNVRSLQAGQITPAPQLVVGDLSFISLTLVIPALVAVAASDAEFLLMVKPQFEVGRQKIGAHGVVRNPEYHVEATLKVAQSARTNGLGIQAVAASPLPGPAGNVEYFLYMRAGTPDQLGENLENAVRTAVANGPAGKTATIGQTSTGAQETRGVARE